MTDETPTSRWISASAALRAVQPLEPNTGWQVHERKLVDWAILRLLPARCTTGRVTNRSLRDGSGRANVITGDIPAHYWEACLSPREGEYRIDLLRGQFSGVVRAAAGGSVSFSLSGVQFEANALDRLIEAEMPTGPVETESVLDDDPTASKPPLSQAELQRWYDGLIAKGVADALTGKQLLAIVRNAYPENHVARARIETFTAGRKRGPKSNSPEN